MSISCCRKEITHCLLRRWQINLEGVFQMSSDSKDIAIKAVAEIASVFASKNELTEEQLFDLLKKLKKEFRLDEDDEDVLKSYYDPERQPAVPISEAVEENRVFCLECGKSMTMLKRHLRVHHDLTVDQYRKRWQLGEDFPLVAPSYLEKKSKMAKVSGLGKYERHNREDA